MAATPASLTEQQIQPLARLRKSGVEVVESELEMESDCSMSAVLPNSKPVSDVVGQGLSWEVGSEGGVRGQRRVPAVQDDCNLLAMLGTKDVVDKGGFPGAKVP